MTQLHQLGHIDNACSCDNCLEQDYNQVQSKEGVWLCTVCTPKYTCDWCGVVSMDVAPFKDSILNCDKMCPECIEAGREPFDLSVIHKVMHDAINRLNRLLR